MSGDAGSVDVRLPTFDEEPDLPPRAARLEPSEIVTANDWRERAVALLDPEVTFTSAVVWVYTRDAAFAAEMADVRSLRLTITLAVRCQRQPAADGTPLGLPSYSESEREAEAALFKACGEDRIAAFGRVGGAQPPEGRPEPIPRHEWSSLESGWDGERRVALPKAPQASGWWWDVQFSRDGLLAEFPPHGGSVPVGEPQGCKPPAKPAKGELTPMHAGIVKAAREIWGDGPMPPVKKDRARAIIEWHKRKGWKAPSTKTIRQAFKAAGMTGQ